MIKSTRAIFLALGLLLALLSPASAQDDGGLIQSPELTQVHRVNAVGSDITVTAISSDYNVKPSDVTVVENRSEVGVTAVGKASKAGIGHEVVFVIDTHSRSVRGGLFDDMLAKVSNEISKLPANASVAVVAAGDIETVEVGMTSNLDEAAQDVLNIGNSSGGAALFSGVARATSLFETRATGIRTVVVVSTGLDIGSVVSGEQALGLLVQTNAQYVGISYDERDPVFSTYAAKAGGAVVSTQERTQLVSAIGKGVAIAEDRLLISYDGVATSRDVRGDVRIAVGSTSSVFSHLGGVDERDLVGLAPVIVPEGTGLAFFRGQTGLYVGIGLAFIAIAMFVWAMASLFAGGDTSLDSLLSRYSQEGADALDEDESKVVQTALVKRAVEISETFAEDKGFLVKIEGSLERANLPLRAGEAMSIFAGVGFLALMLGFIATKSIIAGAIFALIVSFLLVFAVRFTAKRRMKAFEKQLPDTLSLLAGTLRAGYSLPQGLEAVSKEISDPMGYELTRVMTEARLGRELEDALNSTAERLESDDFAWAVMAIGIQREVGGNLNELLMTVADTMIARERLHGEVAALTAEGKMSAVILGMLPPGLGLVMYVMNPDYVRPLFTTGIGKGIIAAALVLMCMGMAWMKKVITINV